MLTVLGLITAIFAASKSKQIRISKGPQTWQSEQAIAVDSQWKDKSQPPASTATEVFRTAHSIANDLNSHAAKHEISNWQVISLTLLSLDESWSDQWAFVVTIEGAPAPRKFIEQISLVLTLNGEVLFNAKNSTVDFDQIESKTKTKIQLRQSDTVDKEIEDPFSADKESKTPSRDGFGKPLEESGQ